MSTVITNIVQRGGAYAVRTTLWRADRLGNKLARIPNDIPVQGNIAYNEDREIKRTLSLEVNNPHAITPFRDYLIPELTLVDAAGNQRTEQQGLYIATPPNTTLTAARFSGTIEAQDITWVLANDELPGGTVVPAGTDTGAAAREIALAVLPADRLNLPDTGILLATDVPPTPGTSRLGAMTALYNTANWYAPWSDGHGIVTTAPWQDLQTARPTRHYRSDADEVTIVPPLNEDPDWGRLRNRVTVRNIAPNREPIYWTAEVTNPDSPVHPHNLGTEQHPLWRSGTPVDDAQIPNEAAARARAESLLANGASYYRKATIQTLVDLTADAHDVIALDVNHQGAVYDGLWFRRTWTTRLRGVTALTESSIYRTEAWQ